MMLLNISINFNNSENCQNQLFTGIFSEVPQVAIFENI